MLGDVLVAASIFLLYMVVRMILKSIARRGTDVSPNLGWTAGKAWSAPNLGLPSETPPSKVRASEAPHSFVVFDLETTGLDATWHEIIEIAAIKVDLDTNTHDSFQALVKGTKQIPKKITQITGISQDMLDQYGHSAETVLRDFAEFIEDLPLVSFNADFTMEFLLGSTQRHDILIRNRASCALKLARAAWPGLASYDLYDLSASGGSKENTDGILVDCERTVSVYTAALSQLGMIGNRTPKTRAASTSGG